MLYLKRFHDRTAQMMRQVILSFVGRAISMVFGLWYVKIGIDYCGVDGYGTFITISSATAFLALSDAGIGAGISNKLAEILTVREHSKACELVSSAYAQLGLILLLTASVALILNWTLPWIQWLGLVGVCRPEVGRLLMAISIAGTLLGLFTGIVNSVATAKGLQSLQTFVAAGGITLTCVLIFASQRLGQLSSESRLLALALAWVSGPVLVGGGTSIWLFRRYTYLRPKLGLIRWQAARLIMGFGGKVFAINVTSYFIFTASNLIISSTCGPAAVAEVTVIQRIFLVLQTAFSLVLHNASTPIIQARTLGDTGWVRACVQKLYWLFALMSIATILVTWLMPSIVTVWMGGHVHVRAGVLWLLCLLAIVSFWNVLHGAVLIAFGHLKEALNCGMAGVVISVTLGWSFGRIFGVEGVLSVMIMALLPSLLVLPFTLSKALKSLSGQGIESA